MPQTQQSKQNIIAQSMIGVSRPQPFRLSDPSDGQGALKSVIQAKLLDIGRGTMQQPVVQLFGENQHLYKQIAAPRGVWRAETRRWILQNAIVTLISGDKVVVSPPRDIEYSMPAPTELGRKTLTLTQYLNDGYYEFASISDLRAYRDVLLAQKPRNSADSHLRQKRINSMTYGIHDKITALFLCVFLVLVGAPLALQSGRTATGFSMGLSLAVLLGYYLLWTCTLALGRGGEINPIALAYFPLGVTATVGVFLFWRKAR